ncbi:hypothetical protein N7495_000457 [Penicillium taxi]|uniref:uncharacterized protein n=1 Tax=Penicillium taxi TaxID=168475 RepID=UPI002545A216|nr:uncharacterized protein N7495_000457 [Penicillium taxi]KAJ5907775.1 hypothetical protein N7495_000457 [Penicillium taxi]
MADEASRPLLGDRSRNPSLDSASHPDEPQQSFKLSSESTPLLHHHNDDIDTYGTAPESLSPPVREEVTDDVFATRKSRVRWPTVISLTLLTTAILAILAFAFAAPAIVKEYVQEAAQLDITAISIDSTTPDGVRARVEADFVMDSDLVNKRFVRTFGRLATWVAVEVETGESNVEVYLPEYGNVLIGTAAVPSIKLNIRDNHNNKLEFLADINAGDINGIHGVALDWIEGRLGRLSVKGKATLHPRSGLINLGTQIVTDTRTFEENEDFPALPNIDIAQLNVHDANDGELAVDVLLTALIDSPVSLTVPALGFQVFVPNCSPGDPPILVANANTAEILVQPGDPISMSVQGLIKKLPDELTTTCPGGDGSPLDFLVSSYIRGLETTIYVRGADAPLPGTPAWIVDLLRSVTVPLSFTGKALDNLVKKFAMSDTHFSLPDPFAEPGTPEAQPSVSALVKVLVALPEQINLSVEVPRVRALTDVYYEGKKLGMLNIEKWQDAKSTQVQDEDGSSALLVEFAIEDVPLQVTDDGVLTRVVQEMLFGSGSVVLHVAASVDAKVSTGLGLFAVRGIPAEGNVPVETPSENYPSHIDPRIVSVRLGHTTESLLSVSTLVNFTNPTPYSATVPFVDVLMSFNGTEVAHIIARNISVISGDNTNISVDFLWNPSDFGGPDGVEAGRTLMSSYISGYNTTITIQTHEKSIPGLPELGRALSIIQIDIPMPQITTPGSPEDGDNGDDNAHFIQDATQVYLWSSTAQFRLLSPLTENSIMITSIAATAFYEKDEPIGRINYQKPFEVPPGLSQTPRIPIDMVLGGVGYDALRKALGQSLKMDAVAKVGVRIGRYEDVIHYRGKGIGAKVKL